MSKSIFFKPFKGDKYEIGINGKKVLVVGASFYCNKTDCPFFADCTNVAKKDSSKYDKSCPEYINDGLLLSAGSGKINSSDVESKAVLNFAQLYLLRSMN